MTALDFGSVMLGGNVFGWTTDRDEGFRVLDAFLDGGGRSIDTADSYTVRMPGNSGGESETIIGDWMASRGTRDRVVLATKVGAMTGLEGLGAATIATAVEESLRRLRTDRIDLYFAHRDDPDTAQEETLSAFDRLVQDGKVREIGASNFSAERLRAAARIASGAGTTPFTVAQDRWSLVERSIETELVPTLEDLGIVQVPYFSLAMGFLTGKYRPGVAIDSPRAGGAAAYLEDPRNVDLLAVLDDVAAEQDVPVSAVALAWLAGQRTVAAPIASARTVDQVTELLAAGRVRFTPQQAAQLSAATEPSAA